MTTGVPLARARRISARKSFGRRTCSMKRTMRLAASPASASARKSSTPATASLPVEIAQATGTPLARRARRRLVVIAPLCAMMAAPRAQRAASWPSGSKVRATPSTKLVKPMQLGPRSARSPPRATAVMRSCFVAPLGPALGKARCEDDGAAGFAADAGLDRIGDGRLRHDQNHGINPVRKLVDRGHAGAAIDLGAVAADEMDVARKARALEIGEHVVADRARSGEAPTMATERGRNRRPTGSVSSIAATAP